MMMQRSLILIHLPRAIITNTFKSPFLKKFALFSFEFPTQCARSKKNLVKRESSRCDKKVWDIWDEQVEVVVVVVEVAVNFSIPTTIHTTICMTYSVMGNESPGSSAAAAFTVVSITP